MLTSKNYNLLISIIIICCLIFIYYLYFSLENKNLNYKEEIKQENFHIKIFPSRFFSGEIVEFEDFILLGYFNYTGKYIKSGNVLSFQSDDLTCELVKKNIDIAEIVEFNNIEEIRKNKFVGSKVCFVNFYDTNLVTRGFYIDKWYWIQVPKDEYYNVKFYIYNK